MSDRTMMDGRYMADVKPIENALDKLAALKAVEFKPLNGYVALPRYGVDGEALSKQFPLAADKDTMGFYYVDLEQLIPVLVAAINELNAKTSRRAAAKKTTAE